MVEYLIQGRPYYSNFYKNLFELPKAKPASSLFSKFDKVPAIICGAGPSLEKNLPLLGTLKDRAIIFAGGTAMNALNAQGMLSTFWCGHRSTRFSFYQINF